MRGSLHYTNMGIHWTLHSFRSQSNVELLPSFVVNFLSYMIMFRIIYLHCNTIRSYVNHRRKVQRIWGSSWAARSCSSLIIWSISCSHQCCSKQVGECRHGPKKLFGFIGFGHFFYDFFPALAKKCCMLNRPFGKLTVQYGPDALSNWCVVEVLLQKHKVASFPHQIRRK